MHARACFRNISPKLNSKATSLELTGFCVTSFGAMLAILGKAEWVSLVVACWSKHKRFTVFHHAGSRSPLGRETHNFWPSERGNGCGGEDWHGGGGQGGQAEGGYSDTPDNYNL